MAEIGPVPISAFLRSALQRRMSRISASVARVWRRFTFSLWLYVNNYCPHTSLNLCSIIQHITWDDRYATPQIFFTRTGQPSAHEVNNNNLINNLLNNNLIFFSVTFLAYFFILGRAVD